MSLQNKVVAVAACFVVAAFGGQSATAAHFTFNEKTNADLAKKLKIPVYFAVPKSTWAKLPDIKTTDKLVDFKVEFGRQYEGEKVRLVVADGQAIDRGGLVGLSTPRSSAGRRQ